MLIFQSSGRILGTPSLVKKKANLATQQDGNLFLEARKSEPKLVPFKDFTPEMLLAYGAAKKSAEKLEKVIYNRTIYMLENLGENQDGMQFLGPNLDDCYFHRQWTRGNKPDYDYNLPDLVGEARANAGVFLLAWHLDYIRKWAPVIAARAVFSSSPDIIRVFSSKEALRSFASGLERKNGDVIVSNEEMQLQFMANGNARMDAGAKNAANFVLKHYPPAPATDATHASTVAFPNLTLSQLTGHYARAFDYFLSENKASSVMLSHSSFPDIEKELARKHPEIKSIIPSNVFTPASLSPNIIRGHLRKELGYEGMAIPDAFNMMGFTTMMKSIFQQAKNKLPQGASISDALAIAAIYAGLNEFPMPSSDRLDYPLPNAKIIWQYYSANKDFKKLFDDLLREKLFFKSKFFGQKEESYQFRGETTIYYVPQYSPNPRMSEMHLSDLHAGSKGLPAEKASILAEIDRQISEMDFAQKISALMAPFSKGTDLRNRGNNFTLQLRKGIIEGIYGLKFPDYPLSTDERTPRNLLGDVREHKKPSTEEISRMEKEWQDSLFSNKEFSKAYHSINWNSVEMRSIFSALEKEAQNPMLRGPGEGGKKAK